MQPNNTTTRHITLSPRGTDLKLPGNITNLPAKLDPKQPYPGKSFGNILNEIQLNKPLIFTSTPRNSASKPSVNIELRSPDLKLPGNVTNQPTKLDPKQPYPGKSSNNILNEIQFDKPLTITSIPRTSGSKPNVSIK